MDKSVLISIRPKWCDLIAAGKKTIEVRKTRPKLVLPFKVYIYETLGKTEAPTFVDEEGHEIYQGRGKVIGEFICDWIKDFGFSYYNHGEYIGIDNLSEKSCLYFEDLYEYIGESFGYGWHISNLKIYDEPKELSDFGLKRPPQSWCYVKGEQK